LQDALKVRTPRKATRVTKSQKKKRLESKRRHSDKKQLRSRLE